jgi:very-short-patch-repair endonuclease
MREVAEYTFVRLGQVTPAIVQRCAIGVMTAEVCESPIETIFGTALLHLFPDVQLCTPDVARNIDRAALIPQFVWRRYRIDWALCAPGKSTPAVFVECDGAAFHSSSEDLARDRRKDIEVVAAGIAMQRFTGKEIVNNHDYCARIVMARLLEAA